MNATDSIKEAQQTPAVQHYPVSKATVQRFTQRAENHQNAAQNIRKGVGTLDSQPTGDAEQRATAHEHLAKACTHMANCVNHSLSSNHAAAGEAKKQAREHYAQASRMHVTEAHQWGSPLRKALGLPEHMVKADSPHSAPPRSAPYPMTKATLERFQNRQSAHYQVAQRLAGEGHGKAAEAHIRMGDACAHVAHSVNHAMQRRSEVAKHHIEQAKGHHQAAHEHHQDETQKWGGPLRKALGLPEPAGTMAKADDESPNAHEFLVLAKAASNKDGNLPHCPEHLKVQLPNGQRVHPQSDEGLHHIQHHVVTPAVAQGPVGQHHLEHLMEGLDTTVTHRVKKADSLAEKVTRKGVAAHEMPDLLGLRVTVNNPAHFDEAQKRLQAHAAGQHDLSGRGISLHGEDDRNKTPMPSGYRSVHFNGNIHGVKAEVQLRKPHQNVWSDWTHDNFYKDDHLKAHLAGKGAEHEFEAVRAAGEAHGKAVADYLDAHGGKVGRDAPKSPEILTKHGLGFPYHKL